MGRPTAKSKDKREICLNTAMSAVTGDRQLNYGSPEDNFERIAIMWNAYLDIRPVPREAPIAAVDVAHFQDLLKTARLVNNPAHADSWADKAGYSACGAAITNAK